MKIPTGLLPAAGLWLGLSGCLGMPDIHSATTADVSSPRAEAIAEIRAEAAAGDHMPYPDAFRAEQTARLAARDEPLSVADVQAIQTELGLIAERRAATTDAREIAALEARARELRRLVLANQATPVRQ